MGTDEHLRDNDPPMRDGLAISSRIDGPRAVVRLRGDLDMSAAVRLDEQLDGMLQSSARSLEIDAGGLQFIDSAGLRSVLQARAEAQARAMEFRVTAVSPAVERVIDLAGLREILLRPAA